MKFKQVCMVISALMFITPVSAARIYGNIWVAPNSKPAYTAEVTITCSGEDAKSSVDIYGRYRLRHLPLNQKCGLLVNFQGRSSKTISVFSGTGNKNMNIELRNSNEGWILVIK